jgi:hypothetical protein
MENIIIDQDFTWGVLAFNSNKSIYTEGEQAYLQMAVIDNNGDTICYADLNLEITAPDGSIATLSSANGLISKSGKCGPNNVVYTPDYFSNYNLAGAGKYQIKLTANTLEGEKEILDSFEVRETVDFDVERISATRIYPKADYQMLIKIKANQDYSGEIKEIIPKGFKIVEQKISNIQETITEQITNSNFQIYNQDEEDVLVWDNIVMQKGDEVQIVYKYDAPDISPEFYLMGPLQIGDFKEAREWQIASDAVKVRAKTVQFFGGVYTGSGTTGQNTNDSNTLPAFDFK